MRAPSLRPDFRSRGPRLMNAAPAARLVVPPAAFHQATPAIHGPRPHPVCETLVGPILIPPLRRHIEIAVDAEKLLAAAPVSRVGVKDVTGVILEEDAVAGQVLQPGFPYS